MASLHLIFSATLALVAAFAVAEENVLLTGQKLSTGQNLRITASSTTLWMQNDCNLVLYKRGQRVFETKTQGKGKGCTLSFTANGRLTLINDRNSTVWITPNFYSRDGKYAAVLLGEGNLVIYGPQVWSTPAVEAVPAVGLEAPAPPNNVLFSGEILGGASITESSFSRNSLVSIKGEGRLILGKNCSLQVLTSGSKVAWSPGTEGKGKYCFVRLDHRGQMAVMDDGDRMLYGTQPLRKEGEYVLIMQANAQAAIYGPVIWSTSEAKSSTEASNGDDSGELGMAKMERNIEVA